MIKAKIQDLKKMKERKLTIDECNSFKKLVNAAIEPGVITTTETIAMVEILDQIADKRAEKRKKQYKKNLKK